MLPEVGMRLTVYTSQEAHLRADVEWLKEQPLLRKDGGVMTITGYIFDIESGMLRWVV